MSYSEKEFRELLDAETFVDLERLRDAARHGIPDSVRGEVWKYLLNVSIPDKSEEVTHMRRMSEEYRAIEKSNPDLLKQVKSEIKRQFGEHDFLKEPSLKQKFENVLTAWLSTNTDLPFNSGIVSMMCPFILTSMREYEIYYCFQALMERILPYFPAEHLNVQVANFMMLVRSTQPELYNYFEDEELEPSDWATGWLRYLLARQIPIQCVQRLWDTYFASEESFDLHMHVCLAILEHSHEILMELDGSEIKQYLQHLPQMDMYKIITQAYNIREDIRARDLF